MKYFKKLFVKPFEYELGTTGGIKDVIIWQHGGQHYVAKRLNKKLMEYFIYEVSFLIFIALIGSW